MKTTILNTDRRIYQINFLHRTTNKSFIFQDIKDLKTILETYDKTGVENIKEYDPIKGTFKRVSKKDILNASSWETETNLYLKNHYYFN